MPLPLKPPRGAIPLLIVCGAHMVCLGALILGSDQAALPRMTQEVISVAVLSPQSLPQIIPSTESVPVSPKFRQQTAKLPSIPAHSAQGDQPAPAVVLNEQPTELQPSLPVNMDMVKAVMPILPVAVVPPRSDASHLNNPAPVYPALSRKLGEQGRVLLSIHVLADGSVGEIQLKQSSGFSRLDEVALVTVKRWKFVPARQGDTSIAYWYTQPMNFTLDGA
ncbi:energy transducer TonB [Chitinimonas sp. PSY-7]|uniref:TonB family protein n=1 Tax=Chitinimonas sp. PSY-7 TaxID=3459088 RepID=UPI0040400697